MPDNSAIGRLEAKIASMAKEIEQLKKNSRQVEIVDIADRASQEEYSDHFGNTVLVERTEDGRKQSYQAHVLNNERVPVRGVHKALWIHGPDVGNFRNNEVKRPKNGVISLDSSAVWLMSTDVPGKKVLGTSGSYTKTKFSTDRDPYNPNDIVFIGNPEEEDPAKRVALVIGKDGVHIQAGTHSSTTWGMGSMQMDGQMTKPTTDQEGIGERFSIPQSLPFWPPTVVTPTWYNSVNLRLITKLANLTASIISSIDTFNEIKTKVKEAKKEL